MNTQHAGGKEKLVSHGSHMEIVKIPNAFSKQLTLQGSKRKGLVPGLRSLVSGLWSGLLWSLVWSGQSTGLVQSGQVSSDLVW